MNIIIELNDGGLQQLYGKSKGNITFWLENVTTVTTENIRLHILFTPRMCESVCELLNQPE